LPAARLSGCLCRSWVLALGVRLFLHTYPYTACIYIGGVPILTAECWLDWKMAGYAASLNHAALVPSEAVRRVSELSAGRQGE
jgi:hypothetical protein